MHLWMHIVLCEDRPALAANWRGVELQGMQVRAQGRAQAARGSQCTAPTVLNPLKHWTLQGFGVLEVTQLHCPSFTV